MIDISSSKITHLVTHRVGNRSRDEGFTLSDEEGAVDDLVSALLLRHYALPLALKTEIMDFQHESNLELNELRVFVKSIFADSNNFLQNSKNIARHLYSNSSHANISGGELIVIKLSDVRCEGITVDAIAILRVENKEDYLKVVESDRGINLTPRKGVSLSRVQKGILILSNDLQIRAIDNLGTKTKYWLEKFVQCKPRLTPEAAVASSSSIIKNITAQAANEEEKDAVVQAINKTLQSGSRTSVSELCDAASNIIGPDLVDKAIKSVELRTGLHIPKEYTLESKSVALKSQGSISKKVVGDGITVVVTNSHAIIVGSNSTREGSRERIFIEIEYTENI